MRTMPAQRLDELRLKRCFWVPAALLPQHGVSWRAVDDNTACATLVAGDFSQQVEVTVDPQGRPTRVLIQRWSNVNPARVYRLQPFGGYLSRYRNFDGYCLPTHVEGGNMIGTSEYFPFYKVDVDHLRFVTAEVHSSADHVGGDSSVAARCNRSFQMVIGVVDRGSLR